jgi:enoyl-CoA hydratase/carnithine racemase
MLRPVGDTVGYELDGAVATLTLNRPQRLNAIVPALIEDLEAALDGAEADDAVRAIRLRGAGRAFCAGYDIEELLAEGYDDGEEAAHPFAAALQAIEAYPYPVVAALNGATIGGGLELAIACDLRIAAGTVQLGMPPAKLGVVYATAGLNRFLTTIGGARTRELFLTGRRIDAATAERWGLVNAVVEAEALPEAALALAREIAGNAPLSLRGNKAGIRELVAARGALDPVVADVLDADRRRAFESEDLR